MATTTPTRRAALGAIAAMPIAISVPSTTSVARPRESVSPELARLIAEQQAADATIDRFYSAAWNPACERTYAFMAQLPHITATVPGKPTIGRSIGRPAYTFSTETPGHVARCRGIIGIPRDQQSTEPHWLATHRAARRVVAGDRWRRQQLRKEESRLGFDRLRIEEERLGAIHDAALDAVEQFPAQSLADVAAKFSLMAERGRDSGIIVEMVGDDLDRLTKREG